MQKLIIFFGVILAVTACKGRNSGPLDRDSFTKKEVPKSMVSNRNNTVVKTKKINLAIEPCKDCITIANLLANKKSYSGKVIKVKGQVTKYNPGIMGKNWVHIQDGTEFEGGYDLTITTDAQTSVGENLTFEGKIILDQDYGYGYYYSILMDNGKPSQ